MNIHYYLIINEQASSGNGRKVARKVIQQLKQQELKYTALYTDYAGHEKELTKELAETTLLPWSRLRRFNFSNPSRARRRWHTT